MWSVPLVNGNLCTGMNPRGIIGGGYTCGDQSDYSIIIMIFIDHYLRISVSNRTFNKTGQTP